MADQKTAPAPPQDELLDQLEKGFAPPWRAIDEGEGATIIGTFLRLENAPTTFGPAVIAIVAEEETGEERSIWLLWETLRNGFRRAQPASGERVAVRYLGKQKVKTQTPGHADSYHNFKVVVDRPKTTGITPDWTNVLGPDPGGFLPDVPITEEPEGDIPF